MTGEEKTVFHARDYIMAESLEQAYELNRKKGNILLGGMLWLRMSNTSKAAAIDLSRLGLDAIEEDEREFRIGCMCSLRALETHEGLNRYFRGVFRECTRHIVGVQFRNCATVGGSVFGRFGFSDILTALMALDTSVELFGAGRIPLAEFAGKDPGRDVLVRVIIQKDGRRAAYVTQRNSGTDFPVIACGAALKECTWYLSVGARPMRAGLLVQPVTDEPLEIQAKRAAGAFVYGTNMRASAEYRAWLAGVYVRRLMERLLGEEGQNGDPV